jgi:hypothetical protein
MANGRETSLRIAIGDYPHTLPLKRGEITSPSLKLDFVEVKPMHEAFKPMRTRMSPRRKTRPA